MNANLKVKMQDWWDELEYDDKVELLAEAYPDEAHLIEADEQWGNLDYEEKYIIYCFGSGKVELTQQEMADKLGDMECHRIMVEGREIE